MDAFTLLYDRIGTIIERQYYGNIRNISTREFGVCEEDLLLEGFIFLVLCSIIVHIIRAAQVS